MSGPPERPSGEPSDEELILFHYGEASDPAAIAARLAASPAARRRYDALVALLAAVDEWDIPELPASYGAELWLRLAPRLRPAPLFANWRAAARWGGRLAPARRWLPSAAAAALLLAVGFLAGRLVPPGGATPSRPLSAEARQRILVETLAQHLDRSQRLFTELANAAPSGELAAECQQARELLAANRVYRAAAERGGREGVASLLGAIEPVLLELAHLPSDPDPGELDFLRRRIESQGLLFKARVASGLLTRSLRTGAPPPPRPNA